MKQISDLDQLDWAAIGARDFRRAEVKEAKQAEFLMHGLVPWPLVSNIGVLSPEMKVRVEQILGRAAHTPPVLVQPDWYF